MLFSSMMIPPRILGVIENLNKGFDGFIPSVNIQTSSEHTNRPIARPYPLEVTAADRPPAQSKAHSNSTDEQLAVERPIPHAAVKE